MAALGQLLIFAIDIYTWIVILQIVIHWLVIFGVMNLNNPQAAAILRLLDRAVDPALKPIKKYIPAIGGIDFSPIILLIGLHILQRIIFEVFIIGATA